MWKTIGQLKEEGYQIQAVRNKDTGWYRGADRSPGPRLVEQPDSAWAGSNLRGLLRPHGLHLNTRQSAGRAGRALTGPLVVTVTADRRKGRRVARHWEAPDGTGGSHLILRPEFEPQRASMLTLVTALAVSEAIRSP